MKIVEDKETMRTLAALLLIALAIGLSVYVVRDIRRAGRISAGDALGILGILVSLIIALFTWPSAPATVPAATAPVETSASTPPFDSSVPVPTSPPIPTLTSTPTFTPVPPTVTFTPSPTQIPTPSAEVLYQADWSKGMNGWSGSNDWKTVDGMLVNSGQAEGITHDSFILAPDLPQDVKNYVIEAEIQVLKTTNICGNVGVFFRGTKGQGYWGGIYNVYCGDSTTAIVPTTNAFYLPGRRYSPDKNWHVYRIEVKGNTYRVLIDDSVWVDEIDNTYLEGSQVGLIDQSMVINVRSFKVFKL